MATKISWDLATERVDGSPLDLKYTVLFIYAKGGGLVRQVVAPAPQTEVLLADLQLENGLYEVEAYSEDEFGGRSDPTSRVTFRIGPLPAPKAPTNLRTA